MEPSIRYAKINEELTEAFFLAHLEEDTSTQWFDNNRNRRPNYKLESCFGYLNALGFAAEKGNLPLIHHLVKIGGQDLLNMGNGAGASALFQCVISSVKTEMGSKIVSKKAHFICPSLLCELGADVNLATSKKWNSFSVGSTPERVTALWVAAEKTTRLDLVKMLLCYGGDEKVCGQLSEKGKAMISKAKNEIHNDIFNENKELLKVWSDSECAFHVFPKEIQDLIITTKLKASKWWPYLLKA
jgi:ankyrin repeat protein